MNKDLNKLKEIQLTGNLIYQDKSMDNALLRRGITIIERNSKDEYVLISKGYWDEPA